MAESRTLKLTFLGDVSNLTSSIKKAENDTDNFGNKMGDIGKKVGVAMAAAAAAIGAYATKLAVDGVKAAMEDEAAQVRLATTLKNVTGATDAQVKSIEEWISKTQLLYGVSDSQLRPTLDRLVRSTKDVGEAQKLTSLAMDISAGTGKDLEAVANALGKAYEGNTTALSKLGLGIDKAQLSTMSFDEVTKALADTFGGQAAKQADTFEGKVRRLSEAWSEAKETVGSFIIDALTPLLDFTVKNLIPTLGELGTAIGEKISGPAQAAAGFVRDALIPAWSEFWTFITETLIPTLEKALKPALDKIADTAAVVTEKLKDNSEEGGKWLKMFSSIAEFATKVLVPALGFIIDKAITPLLDSIKSFVSAVDFMFRNLTSAITRTVDFIIAAINKVISAYNAIPFLGNIGSVSPVNWNGSGQANFGRASGSGSTAMGGAISVGTATVASALDAVKSATSGSGGSTQLSPEVQSALTQVLKDAMAVTDAMIEGQVAIMNQIIDQMDIIKSTPTTINVEGALVDSEGVARAIQDVLNKQATRTGSLDFVMV